MSPNDATSFKDLTTLVFPQLQNRESRAPHRMTISVKGASSRCNFLAGWTTKNHLAIQTLIGCYCICIPRWLGKPKRKVSSLCIRRREDKVALVAFKYEKTFDFETHQDPDLSWERDRQRRRMWKHYYHKSQWLRRQRDTSLSLLSLIGSPWEAQKCQVMTWSSDWGRETDILLPNETNFLQYLFLFLDWTFNAFDLDSRHMTS